MSQLISTHASLEGFFQELVAEALAAERLDLTDAATAYLTQTVADLGRRDALHAGGHEDESGTPTLFRLYERAVNCGPRERFDAYRHLGDVALIVSGFFAPHIQRSLVNVGYYVEMGRSAYHRAALLSTGGAFSNLLAQLAHAFNQVVEVLTRVAEKTTLPVPHDLVALYERWARNADSANLTERLLAGGAIPLLQPQHGIS